MALALLLVYAAAQIALGLWIGRRVRQAGEFFVAGRRLGPGVLFATFVAANIGAGSTVGAAGLGYRDGLSAWWWVGSAGLGSIVLALWVGPRIRQLAAAHDLRTVGDFLEWRYGPAVRATIAALLWVGTLAILAGQLIALAWVLNVVAGVPKAAGCLVGGLVMTTYFAAGGLLGSASVNVLQLVVLLGGFALAWPFVAQTTGGLSALGASGDAARLSLWHTGADGRSGWILLALLGPAFIVSPGLLQKIYGARDDRTVRLGVGLNALVLLAFAAVPPLFGMLARLRHPGLDNPELALPTVLVRDVPAAVGSLGLAALFSAEVSSADAILFMLATSLSQDLYRRFVRPRADDRHLLRVARMAAVAGGALGVVLAIAAPSIIGVLTIFYTLLTVSLFVPVLAGLFSRRPGSAEALAAIAAGVTSVLAGPLLGATGGVVTPPLVGVGAAAAAFGLVALGRHLSGRGFAKEGS
jgi:SSS family solute:Na+ symporter